MLQLRLLIAKHPMGGVRYAKPIRAVDDIQFLTVEEQKKFWKWQSGHIITHLYKLCGEAGIKRFCVLALRHTYATGAIESGMQPGIPGQRPSYSLTRIRTYKMVQ